MKKFIDRMESAQEENGGSAASAPGAPASGEKKKRGWGLGGMVRKVTGGAVSTSQGAGAAIGTGKKEASSGEGQEEARGVQVDFYLVIVSRERLDYRQIADVPVFEVHCQHRTDYRGGQHDLDHALSGSQGKQSAADKLYCIVLYS